jgi:hypothetical protein
VAEGGLAAMQMVDHTAVPPQATRDDVQVLVEAREGLGVIPITIEERDYRQLDFDFEEYDNAGGDATQIPNVNYDSITRLMYFIRNNYNGLDFLSGPQKSLCASLTAAEFCDLLQAAGFLLLKEPIAKKLRSIAFERLVELDANVREGNLANLWIWCNRVLSNIHFDATIDGTEAQFLMRPLVTRTEDEGWVPNPGMENSVLLVQKIRDLQAACIATGMDQPREDDWYPEYYSD